MTPKVRKSPQIRHSHKSLLMTLQLSPALHSDSLPLLFSLCLYFLFPSEVYHTQKSPKRVYYLSLEFLLGRSLDNAVINLKLKNEYRLETVRSIL